MKSDKSKYLLAISMLSLAAVIYFTCGLHRAGGEIARSELWWLGAARTTFQYGSPRWIANPDITFTQSPSLYPEVMAAAFSIFGFSDHTARVAGVLLLALSLPVTFVAVLMALPHKPRAVRALLGALACLVTAATPLFNIGGAITDIDNTIFTPLLLLFAASSIRIFYTKSRTAVALASLSLALCLWCKLTTPPVVAIALACAAMLHAPARARLKPFAFALFTGFSIFVVTWFPYCTAKNLDAVFPFRYFFLQFIATSAETSGALYFIATNFLADILWLGLFLTLAIMAVTISSIARFIKTRTLSQLDFYLIAALSVLVGFTIIGGAVSGFPKYIVPAIPLIAIALSLALAEKDMVPPLSIIIAALAIAFLARLLPADLIYTYRYTIRNAAILSLPAMPVIKAAIIKTSIFILAAALPAVVCILNRRLRPHLITVLIVTAIGANISLSAILCRAGYQTAYNHGLTGFSQTVAFLKSSTPSGMAITAPNEIIYALDRRDYSPDFLFDNPHRIRHSISSRRNYAYVFSIPTHSSTQARVFFDTMKNDRILASRYTLRRFGSFYVYTRKNNRSPD